MLQLFLCEPTQGDDCDNDEAYEQRSYLLGELESVIWSLMSSVGLGEARLWLCNALSVISSISANSQRDLFLILLKSKRIKRQLASQVLQLIFEKHPQKMGPIIAKKSHKLINFFEGNPRRISQWFSKFSATGDLRHGKGAKALSQFAFINRDICWEELEWKGKHGQSPAMVATKPHYFLDLDVQRTVENFIEYVPEFWSSHEFSESLKDGDILLIDANYFVDLFIDLMYEDKQTDVWDVVEEFLMEQSFSFLCRHLLISLEEQGFRLFLELVPKYLNSKPRSIRFGHEAEWLEIILSTYGHSASIDQLLLLNAVTNQSRQLIRFVKEEGSEEEKGKIKELVFQLTETSGGTNCSALKVEECLTGRALELVKKLGLLSWAIHFRLSEEFLTSGSWESLFVGNGIKFRKSERSALPQNDGFSDDCGSDEDGSSMVIKHKKHRKHRKKRKRDLFPAKSYEDDLVDFNVYSSRLELLSKAGDWLLSTDGFSTRWSSVSFLLSTIISSLPPRSFLICDYNVDVSNTHLTNGMLGESILCSMLNSFWSLHEQFISIVWDAHTKTPSEETYTIAICIGLKKLLPGFLFVGGSAKTPFKSLLYVMVEVGFCQVGIDDLILTKSQSIIAKCLIRVGETPHTSLCYSLKNYQGQCSLQWRNNYSCRASMISCLIYAILGVCIHSLDDSSSAWLNNLTVDLTFLPGFKENGDELKTVASLL